MTIEECYEKIGGNFAEAKERLINEKMINRFVGMFLKDQSFAELKTAMEAGDREEAFRGAHTLKGVCGNLSFTALFEKASELTESLRNNDSEISEEARVLFENVEQAYRNTVETIQAYIG